MLGDLEFLASIGVMIMKGPKRYDVTFIWVWNISTKYLLMKES